MIWVGLRIHRRKVLHSHEPHNLGRDPKDGFDILPRPIITLYIGQPIHIHPLPKFERHQQQPIQHTHRRNLIFQHPQIAHTPIEPYLHGREHIDISHFRPLIEGECDPPLRRIDDLGDVGDAAALQIAFVDGGAGEFDAATGGGAGDVVDHVGGVLDYAVHVGFDVGLVEHVHEDDVLGGGAVWPFEDVAHCLQDGYVGLV